MGEFVPVRVENARYVGPSLNSDIGSRSQALTPNRSWELRQNAGDEVESYLAVALASSVAFS